MFVSAFAYGIHAKVSHPLISTAARESIEHRTIEFEAKHFAIELSVSSSKNHGLKRTGRAYGKIFLEDNRIASFLSWKLRSVAKFFNPSDWC